MRNVKYVPVRPWWAPWFMYDGMFLVTLTGDLDTQFYIWTSCSLTRNGWVPTETHVVTAWYRSDDYI